MWFKIQGKLRPQVQAAGSSSQLKSPQCWSWHPSAGIHILLK